MTHAHTFEVILSGNALVLAPEARFVTETATGLTFAPDTPIEVWGGLVERLQRQQKVIEWAVADAINFGEAAYGELYSQWVDETGLSKRTLQNIASVGRRIERSRRRELVSFAHHAEVAYLPVPDQETLLDRAEHVGMTRYELRDAVRERKRQLEGRAVDAAGAPLPGDDLAWTATRDQLTPECRLRLEIRLSEMGASRRSSFEAGWLAGHMEANALGCFVREDAS